MELKLRFTDLSYSQILTFLRFKPTTDNEYYTLYEKNNKKFLLYIDENTTNEQCLLINEQKLYSKYELFYNERNHLSLNDVDFNIEQIKEVPKEKLEKKAVTKEQLVNIFFNLYPFDYVQYQWIDADIINNLSKDPYHVLMYNYAANNQLAIPLYYNNIIHDILIFDNKNYYQLINHPCAYFLSENETTEEPTKLFIVFNPNTLIEYSLNTYLENGTFFFAPKQATFKLINDIFKEKETIQSEQLNFLINNTIQERKQLLEYLIILINRLKSVTISYVELNDEYIITIMYDKKLIKPLVVADFHARLSENIRENLGFNINTQQNEEQFFDSFKFKTDKFSGNEVNFFTIKVAQRKELLEVFTTQLIDFVDFDSLIYIKDCSLTQDENTYTA